jgi:hypothetical protein
MDFGSRFGAFGRDGTNNNNCRMTTHEYQASRKGMTVRQIWELNEMQRREKSEENNFFIHNNRIVYCNSEEYKRFTEKSQIAFDFNIRNTESEVSEDIEKLCKIHGI